MGKVVMGARPHVVTGSFAMMNLSLPFPEDSDRGLLNGSRSSPEVEEGMVCGGPGVLGEEADFPLAFARLCFLYLTWKRGKRGLQYRSTSRGKTRRRKRKPLYCFDGGGL